MFQDKTASLFGTSGHSLTLVQSRMQLVHARVKLTALIVALLLAAWIPVDLFFMPWDDMRGVVFARALSAALLVWLIFYKPHVLSPFIANAMLVFLLTVPMLFFCYVNMELRGFAWAEQSLFFKSAYAHLPILIVMLLSMFPLTAVEGALLGGGLTLITVIAASISGTPAQMLVEHGTLWIQLVVTVLAVIAGMSQLHFMAGFVEYSTRDDMTGCLKRDYGMSLMDALFAACARKKNPCCFVFVDLDHFKKVNDVFGHHAGDNVLKEAALHLRAVLRRQDAVVRWGGEEFVVIMPDTAAKDAQVVLQRLKEHGLGKRPDGQVQTASIGVAEYLEDGLKNAQETVLLADQRMYAAKQAGRNKVMMKSGGLALAS